MQLWFWALLSGYKALGRSPVPTDDHPPSRENSRGHAQPRSLSRRERTPQGLIKSKYFRNRSPVKRLAAGLGNSTWGTRWWFHSWPKQPTTDITWSSFRKYVNPKARKGAYQCVLPNWTWGSYCRPLEMFVKWMNEPKVNWGSAFLILANSYKWSLYRRFPNTQILDRITVENFLFFKEHLFRLDLFWNRISPCGTETGLASSSQAFASWRLG